MAPALDEERKIGDVVRRMPQEVVDRILVIDDGSTDRTAAVAMENGATVLPMGRVAGVGAALRAGLRYARKENFDIAVIVAGNNKDDPAEIPRLLAPIVDEQCDLVVGSRFLEGGGYGGDMPGYRKLATRLHPWLMSRFLGKSVSETTNGFRAIRLTCLDDDRINLDQDWLDGYSLEVYLLFRFIRCGYRHKEVPCTKIYPPKALGITKMKPLIGWWDMLRPILLLGLGIKK